MRINYYKTYLQTIKNSIWSKAYTQFFIDDFPVTPQIWQGTTISQEQTKTESSRDILHNGSVSCAYFVSNILKQFNLTTVWRANVPKVMDDLLDKWWTSIDPHTPAQDIPVWSILVREWSYGETYEKIHRHIGFYIWDETAISNNSVHFTWLADAWLVPVEHHYTYNGQRTITHIFTRPWDEMFAPWLYHYELDLSHIHAVWHEDLAKEWLTDEEITFRSGDKEWMHYGKLCGVSAVTIASRYLLWVPPHDIRLEDCLQYADHAITYMNSKTWQEQSAQCYTPGIWRYHSWLIHIAIAFGQKYNHTITGSLHTCLPDDFMHFVQTMLHTNAWWKKQVIIASVTLHFNTTKEKKWGHLVTIAWVSYNEQWLNLIIHDSIDTEKKYVSREQFKNSFSGNFIVLEGI